ncbi:MAG: hypothetical protein ACLTQI_01235 [Slackia sp.]
MFWTVVADERAQKLQGSYGGRYKLAILDAYLPGYIAGIAAKFCSGCISWVLAVYFINLACLAVNWGVYFRNKKLDAAEAAEKQAAA